MHTLGFRHLVFAGIAVLFTILLGYFIGYKWWQRWDYDPVWAVANIKAAGTIIDRLEETRPNTGSTRTRSVNFHQESNLNCRNPLLVARAAANGSTYGKRMESFDCG